MAQKINRKCKDCRHCSPPSIITKKNWDFEDVRKIVYRCMLGINHTPNKNDIMLIDDNSDYKCSSFSRK